MKWFVLLSFALFAATCPPSATAFFSLFRRRQQPAPPILEEASVAQPVRSFGFPQFGGLFGGRNQFLPFLSPFQLQQFQQQRPMAQFPSQKQQQQQQQQVPASHQQQFPSQNQMGQFAGSHQQSQLQAQQPVPMQDPYRDQRADDDDMNPSMNYEEAESFFALLAETDESKCISRLVCEMGANPNSGGEFGQTIGDIIGSLSDFPRGSKVSEYNEVLNLGRNQGISACTMRFSLCDNESFQMVKNAQAADAAGEQ